jgi:hypothetical protein
MALETLTASEISAIEEHRLARRWSYRELAADVSDQTDTDMPEATLYKALAEPRRPLRATTVHPIRRYLALISTTKTNKQTARALKVG